MTRNRTTTKQNEGGAAMLEVAILIALLLVVAIPAINSVGKATSDQFDTARRAIGAADIRSCTPSHPNFPDC